MDKKQLVNEIVRLEWAAFQEVQNEGGRASCQDNNETFDIMRKSQYLTWTEEMLAQYKSDFEANLAKGWNMVTEKYARMMESNAKEEFEAIKNQLPKISPSSKELIEKIVAIQVKWMEEFAAQYPNLANQGRAIHTSEDTEYNTSYETYLRGEISTYSTKMLLLYAAFILDLQKRNANLSKLIMKFTTAFYGYASLDAAETKLKYTNAAKEVTDKILSNIPIMKRIG
ncbi:MAG: DUF4125 family protein [Lachnospiraceae bacterium]|nr:DUF4125 family protein [Lachnospiraceae bacterium]